MDKEQRVNVNFSDDGMALTDLVGALVKRANFVGSKLAETLTQLNEAKAQIEDLKKPVAKSAELGI